MGRQCVPWWGNPAFNATEAKKRDPQPHLSYAKRALRQHSEGPRREPLWVLILCAGPAGDCGAHIRSCPRPGTAQLRPAQGPWQ